jgi:3D (Asp-Asp-Asp) domain-containing protein
VLAALLLATVCTTSYNAAAQEANCNTYTITFYSSEAFPGYTASGIRTLGNEWTLVAVDPNVIPLGTNVWVDGLGTFLAADTGGGVHGYHIDVLVYTQQEALALGRQRRVVCF